MNRNIMKKLICLIVLLQFGLCAFASSDKLANELKTSKGNVRVIVQFNDSMGAEHLDLMHAKGGKLHRKLDVIKAGAFDIFAERLAELADDARLTDISVDPLPSITMDNAAAAATAAAALYSGLTG